MSKTCRETFLPRRSNSWSHLEVRRLLLRIPPRLLSIPLIALFFVAPARATISYQLSLAHPEQHTFHVKMTIPDVKDSITVQMPAWNALYEIRDFASHVLQATAANESGPLPVEKLDKQTWRIKGAGKITISYDTFWDEPGPFASQLNTEHAFINSAMLLMYIPARRQEKVSVTLEDVPFRWMPAAFDLWMSMGPGPDWFGQAVTYDRLADSPVEMGRAEQVEFSGAPKLFFATHGKLEHPDA